MNALLLNHFSTRGEPREGAGEPTGDSRTLGQDQAGRGLEVLGRDPVASAGFTNHGHFGLGGSVITDCRATFPSRASASDT